MSHSVKVTLIADQEILLFGFPMNIHNIESLTLDGGGVIIECCYNIGEPLNSIKKFLKKKEEIGGLELRVEAKRIRNLYGL